MLYLSLCLYVLFMFYFKHLYGGNLTAHCGVLSAFSFLEEYMILLLLSLLK